MTRFPARRIYWSAVADLPEVGPTIGIDEPPFHAALLEELTRRYGERVWASPSYGGWLELRNGVYRLGADADGRDWAALSEKDQALVIASIQRWARSAGVPFIP